MKRPSHILVIRFSAMGDVAMTVPVLRVFTKSYPDIRITIVSRGFFQPLFQHIPNVSFYEADLKGRHKGVLGMRQLAKELNALGIDAVADLHNVIRSKLVRAFLKFHNMPTAVLDKGRNEKAKLIKANGDNLPNLKSTHERYAEVLRELGFPINLNDFEKPEPLTLSENARKAFGNSGRKKVGVAPFAAFTSKMYPIHKMKELLSRLDNTGKYDLMLFGGGASEVAMLNAWEKELKHAVNMAGHLSYEEELQCVSNLDLMISMDSGNGHLAAIYGVPVITLWGVTHPSAGFAPFNQPVENQLLSNREQYPLIPTSVYGNKYPEGYESAMQTITAEEIIGRIEAVLN